MPNLGIETMLRRELDSLPLPPESEWLPSGARSSGWSTALWLATGTVTIVLALIAGSAWRELRAVQSDEGAVGRPTPPVLPTVVNGRGVRPLPKVSQHAELGFNIVIQANWRETGRRSLSDQATPIGRVTYTAHSPDHWLALLDRYGIDAQLPWDVVATAWLADGLTAEQWARTRGGCASGCAFGTTKIHGTQFVTTVDDRGAHAFYVLRGDRMLIFSFIIGVGAERPEGVTVETLEQMIASIGLVDP